MSSWLFRRRIKVLPGVFVNISRSGIGLGVGAKGANVSLNRKGVYANSGLPGSGIYRRDKLVDWNDIKNKQSTQKKVSIKNKKQQITSTISKARQTRPKIIKKQSYIVLQMDNKNRIIVNNFTFGRNECRSSFEICDEIYTRQFTILKDKSGEWFIQGLQVPKVTKNKEGDTLHFYHTFYNGQDITNKVQKLIENGEIQIGNRTIKANINYN